jgi:hypothetical protein
MKHAGKRNYVQHVNIHYGTEKATHEPNAEVDIVYCTEKEKLDCQEQTIQEKCK